MLRVFAPRQAVVLVRRRSAAADRLVVAAAGPEGCRVRLGAAVALDEGQLGFIAGAERVMTRRELESNTPVTQRGLWRGNLQDFETDLGAPLVFEDDILGVIALEKPERQVAHQKRVLRLIAQLGAWALHDAWTFSEVRQAADLDPLTRTFN